MMESGKARHAGAARVCETCPGYRHNEAIRGYRPGPMPPGVIPGAGGCGEIDYCAPLYPSELCCPIGMTRDDTNSNTRHLVPCSPEISRRDRLEFEPLSIGRVVQAQAGGVQGLAGHPQCIPASIDSVGNQGKAARRGVM
jgi:hypothetical protein